MSKYQRLGAYLRAQHRESVEMSFGDVERAAGTKLPASAMRHRAWWSNNPENNVATKEWRDAGYMTEQVDLEQHKVGFRKTGPTRVAEGATALWGHGRTATTESPKPVRDPLFGAHKGLITIAPGVDLTEPADPEWAKIVEG